MILLTLKPGYIHTELIPPVYHSTIAVKPHNPIFRAFNRVVGHMGGCYNSAMKVSELGEFGLIDLLAEIVSKPSPRQKLLIGIGDDAATWQSHSGITLATTDSLIQGVHFTPDTTGWRDLGWKALAVSLSDIAAMGGTPLYALVSLALPGNTEVDDVAELYKGVAEAADKFDVAIAGGDTDSSTIIVVNTAVFGSGQAGCLLTRSAASVGDKIAVTGWLGGAGGGLKMLTDKIKFAGKDTNALKQAFHHPLPRIAEGQLLSQQGVKAAIDISDGLLADLGHICRQSRVGARVDIDSVPVHPAVIAGFGDKALDMALGGGEDYELLFTASGDTIEKVKKAASCQITIIGTITDDIGNIKLANKEGKPYTPAGVGWQHFRQ